MTRRGQAGFSLVEVLLATVLLAAGLALAFTTVRAAGASVQRGELRAAEADRMRSVAAFLRRGIGGARPVAFGTDPQTGARMLFDGEPQRMRFVADLPAYLGYGSAYLHELHVERVDGSEQLLAQLAVVLAGSPAVQADPQPPELLAGGLREVRFRYRGLDRDGRLAPWQERWQQHQGLPVQVEVQVQPLRGPAWPRLVIAVALADARGATVGGAAP